MACERQLAVAAVVVDGSRVGVGRECVVQCGVEDEVRRAVLRIEGSGDLLWRGAVVAAGEPLGQLGRVKRIGIHLDTVVQVESHGLHDACPFVVSTVGLVGAPCAAVVIIVADQQSMIGQTGVPVLPLAVLEQVVFARDAVAFAVDHVSIAAVVRIACCA